MEEVQPPKREEFDAREDLLVKQLRAFLFDKNMHPRKGRKEFLLAIIADIKIPKEDALAAVSDEVRQILEPLYNIDPKYPPHKRRNKETGTLEIQESESNRRLDYLLTLIRRVTINMGTVPKGPFHQHLLPRLSMPALETYAKSGSQARKEVDKYYRSIIAQHQLTDIQTRILTAIHHKDIKKLKAALNNPNFQITDLNAIGIFDPLLYAHLNDFQEGLNAIYSICSIKRSQLPDPIDLLALQIRTHQNKNRWPNNIDYYEFSNTVRHYVVSKTQLLHIACDANNREMVNFLCATYGFMETAIQAGDLTEVKRLLENGANPTDYPVEHWYANAGRLKPYNYIHFAIAAKQTEIAKYLIDQTSVEDICDDENIFAKAAEANSLEILKHLFKKTVNKNISCISAHNVTNYSPLQHACRNGNVGMATYLAKKLDKTSINAGACDASIERRHGQEQAYTGRTALYFACNQENPDIAKTLAEMLLNHGAEVDKASRWGETPLLAAYCNNHVGLAKILIEKGANPLRLLSPMNFTFSLRGTDEGEIDHVKRIQNNIPADAGEDLVIQMLNRYIKDHPDREIAQRLLNTIEGKEPQLTGGDKFRLFFAPTLGKIYKIAEPFLKPREQDLQSFAEVDEDGSRPAQETDPLLGSESPNSPRKIAQGTAVASRAATDNSNNDEKSTATFPRSRSSSKTEFGLSSKKKEEMHPSSAPAPASQPRPPKATKE